MSTISTFGTFTMARLGIYTSSRAMEVVGNNIANINTEGYTRQKVDQISLYLGGADRYVSRMDARIGQGSVISGLSQFRDPYLDIRYRNEVTSASEMDEKLGILDQLRGVIDEVGKGTDGEGVLEAHFNELISRMNDLVTQGAGKDSYDSLVREAAVALTKEFNNKAGQLQKIYDQEMSNFENIMIPRVNEILSNIQQLTSAIRTSEIHGGDALELRDSRNLLIDELSEYLDVEVTYGSEDLGGGLIVEKMTIKTGDHGHKIIDGVYASQLSIYNSETDDNLRIELSPLKNLQNEVLKDQNGDNWPAVLTTDTELHGRIQAVREMLTEVGEYTEGDVLDGTAFDMSAPVPAAPAPAPGAPTTTPDPPAKDPSVKNQSELADPLAKSKHGIKYYQNALDTLARKFATVLNDINTGADGNVLFSNDGTNDETNPPITAANISVSKGWASGTTRMVLSKENADDSTPNDVLAQFLVALRADQKFDCGDPAPDPFFTGSFQEMLTENISGTLGMDIKTSESMLQNYTTLVDELYTDRDSVSGVDLNDEAMNMMQLQKSYSAACRLMTTVDEMLDKLINGTGRAGL